MEAITLRNYAHAPAPRPCAGEDWDWVYDDPDLAPFRADRRARKETPLTAFA